MRLRQAMGLPRPMPRSRVFRVSTAKTVWLLKILVAIVADGDALFSDEGRVFAAAATPRGLGFFAIPWPLMIFFRAVDLPGWSCAGERFFLGSGAGRAGPRDGSASALAIDVPFPLIVSWENG